MEGSDLLCLTETQIGCDEDFENIQKIEQNLKQVFKIGFHNDPHKYNSMAICHREDDVNILDHDQFSGFSIVTFKKDSFSEKEFLLLLLYRSSRVPLNVFLCQLANFIVTYKIDFVIGDFNMNGLDAEACSLLNEVMSEYQLFVNYPTHIDGALLDHVYVSKDILKHFDIITLRRCVNISDHDALKIKLLLKEMDDDE